MSGCQAAVVQLALELLSRYVAAFLRTKTINAHAVRLTDADEHARSSRWVLRGDSPSPALGGFRIVDPPDVAALADEKISIRGMTTVTDKQDNVAHMRLGISISGLPQLSKVLARIAQLPNIISARRRK